jgi:hypothetical protein
MRVGANLLVVALLLAGCVTGSASSRSAAERRSSAASPGSGRCSAGDPDRWAWFCVIGQGLYNILSALQPDTDLRSK